MIIFLILIFIIWLISKKSEKVRFWKEKIIQQPLNYYLLLGLLIVGFIFRLDYTIRAGCLIHDGSIFELRNILFSVISITLVLLSFFSKNRKIKFIFISLELLFWVSKLFLFKGGYSVGIANMVDPIISLYDTTTLVLRFFIINSLLKTNIRKLYIFICTIIIMSIKIFIFSVPYSFYVRENRVRIASEITQSFLRGKWIENIDTTEKIKIIFLPSENAIIYNFRNQESLFFDDVGFGRESVFLSNWRNPENHQFYIFEFQKIGNDTLNVNFRFRFNDDIYYSTQMIRKIDYYSNIENTRNFLMGKWTMEDKLWITFYPESADIYDSENNDSSLCQIIWGTENQVFFFTPDTNFNTNFMTVFEFQKQGQDTINVNFRVDGEIHYSTQMIRKVSIENQEIWNKN
jgi:hypothetical protein